MGKQCKYIKNQLCKPDAFSDICNSCNEFVYLDPWTKKENKEP